MFVSDVALDYFRSYDHLVLALQPGVSVFLGANGQGKTNFLEALNYLAVLSSHRVGTDRALIFQGVNDLAQDSDLAVRPGFHAGVIRVRVHSEFSGSDLANSGEGSVGRGDLLEVEILAGKANRAMINRHPVRPRKLLGKFSAVLFAPEDLDLVRGNPDVRRGFIDNIAVQMYPGLAGVLADYDKVARQRGAYLRSVARAQGVLDETQIRIWDEALAPLAARIMGYRYRVVSGLNTLLPQIYGEISGSAQPVSVWYADNVSQTLRECGVPGLDYLADAEFLSSQVMRALELKRVDEQRRGVNLTGVHRDEVKIFLQGFPVKGFASHGEAWSVVLALRLAEFALLKEVLEVSPLLLLDDVFSELDEKRRAALLGAVRQADQVLITSALGTELPSDLEANFFQVYQDECRVSRLRGLGFGNFAQVAGGVSADGFGGGVRFDGGSEEDTD